MEYYNLTVGAESSPTELIQPSTQRQSYITAPFTEGQRQPQTTNNTQEWSNATITTEQLVEIVSRALSSLKVYVVEADITAAQSSVRAVVEQASF